VAGGFEAFVDVIARLRAPEGCPWDREQTHASIARNMIEEAYEAVDAIERGDMVDLREELGDVLLQVVLQSQIASEEDAFSIEDVVTDVRDKMIRRHPHVFGVEEALLVAHLTPEQRAMVERTETAKQVLSLWDQVKLIEKRQKAERKRADAGAGEGVRAGADVGAGAGEGAGEGGCASEAPSEAAPRTAPDDAPEAPSEVGGLLDDIPHALPALMQAQGISRKAVSVGFEWPDVASVWEQVASEIEEYRAEAPGSMRAAEEFGDVLFSLVNVARKEGIDAESALRSTCRTFRARWAIMERSAQEAGKQLIEYPTEGLEELWRAAKTATQDAKEVRQ
jgi:uncharacterized protein YabN with tetrapyrrole methylase and pyrophosphatase domain